MRVDRKKIAERKQSRYSFKKVQEYVKRYAENCRYSYNKMLSL